MRIIENTFETSFVVCYINSTFFIVTKFKILSGCRIPAFAHTSLWKAISHVH